MAVRQVEEKDVRPRLRVRGAISSNVDYSAVMAQIPAVIRENKALEVDLDLNGFPEVKDRKKIPFLFCASLRRWFANNGIPAEAYQSGPALVTIRRTKTAPKKPVQKRR